MYLTRIAEKTIQRYLSSFPVLGITGLRQSGKSTMLQHVLSDYEYVNFDDIKNIQRFENDPEDFLARYSKRVIFDEAQYVPQIFNYLKIAIDKDRSNYGNFVLTGSNQFAYLKKTSESLAGRIGLMSLLPLQYSEMPKALTTESIYQGAYPELVTRDYRESDLWYSSYLDTYLNKDVRVISHIGDMRDFQRFIQLLAARTSQILDMTHFAKEIGVSVPTIKRWVSILEASYIIFLLPPFYNNYGKRIIKSPKVYFYDTGLVSYLTGIKSFGQYENGPLAGAIFENYIIAETKKKLLHEARNSELFYIRTSDQTEIDLIIDNKDSQIYVEIKKTASFKSKMISALKKYTQNKEKAYLVYNGVSEQFNQNINIIHYSEFLEQI